MIEEWKPVKDYDDYLISNFGRVKSIKYKKERILKPKKNHKGYLSVGLSNNGKYKNAVIHRLVANAFLENTYNLPQVNHKDENKQNNCVSNLEFCTNDYNMKYSRAKKVIQYDKENNFIKEWNCINEAQRELNILHIVECCQGKIKNAGGYIWKYKDIT